MKKKKAKKTGLAGATDTVMPAIKKAGSTAIMFGAATAGLALGSFGMKKVPNISQLPAFANKLLPGILGMTIAAIVGAKSTNSNLKAAALGLGLAGFTDAVNKTLGDYIPDQFKLPQLSGLGNPYNYGGYPPEYFTRSVNGYGDSLALGEPNRMQLGEMANPLSLG